MSESKKYEPELGQSLSANYMELSCPSYVEKALGAIKSVMEVSKKNYYTPFSNSGEKFKNDVFEANAFDWSECMCYDLPDDECKCGHIEQTYNFKWKDFEVSWYKYLGRGMSINRAITQDETNKMLSECLESLRL